VDAVSNLTLEIHPLARSRRFGLAFQSVNLRSADLAQSGTIPAEPVWSWLKWGQLSNFAPTNAIHLNERVVGELTTIQDDQEVLRGFWNASDLPLPRALLF
jgi:hypothetical protein